MVLSARAQIGTSGQFWREQRAADPTGYRFAAARSQCFRLTRKTSDGANSHCKASRLLNRLAQLGGQQHAPDGLSISRVCAVENGVCREFTPVLANSWGGRMLWVRSACICLLTSEFGSMGLRQTTQANRLNLRKSRKIRGFPIKVRKQSGDVVQLVRTLPCHRLPAQNQS